MSQRPTFIFRLCVLVWLMNPARATTLPPELKAYDFARA